MKMKLTKAELEAIEEFTNEVQENIIDYDLELEELIKDIDLDYDKRKRKRKKRNIIRIDDGDGIELVD